MLFVPGSSNIRPERHRCVVRGGEKAQASDFLIYFFLTLRKKTDIGESEADRCGCCLK